MGQLRGPLAVLVCVAAGTAHAQTPPPPNDQAIDVQLFRYAIGPKTFLTVDNGDVSAKQQLAMDALVTFLTNPFSVYTTTGPNHDHLMTPVRDNVVGSLTAAQLTAAYGVTDKLQLGANLPLVFALTGDGLDPTSGKGMNGGLSVTGLGDLLLEAKYQLWRQNALQLAGIGGVTAPTSFGSGGSAYIGDNLPTLEGRAAAQYTTGRLSFGATAGFILRKPRTVYASTIGPQWTLGLAGAFAVTDRFSVIAESYGRTGITSFALDESPIEAVGGLRAIVATSVAIVVGGGGGLDRAIGAPTLRVFASIGYAPDVRDSDGDGIPNDRDKCPLAAEDKDGFQDEDGCPDDDNDGDGIPDRDDKCPNQAEDHDGFEDDDGCPDLDNDKDGIPDLQDKCPNDPEDGKQPYPNDGCPANKRDSDGDGIPDSEDQCPLEEEDFDGFEDGDGCPDPDNDGDGIPDAVDKCPLCPEDKDGFQDADGCPDLDNDHDGIPDSRDQCPNEPETINGIQDEDGCPDTGGLQLALLDGDRLTVSRMPSSANDQVVRQMALVMAGHAEITKWLIAVAMPSRGTAQSLGDAIKKRLETFGVTGVEVLAAAGPNKIGAIVQERAAADAPPVCPANLVAKPRPDAEAKPKPGTPSPASTPAPATPMTPAPAPAKPATAKPATPAAKPQAAKPAPKPAPPAKKPDDEIEMGN